MKDQWLRNTLTLWLHAVEINRVGKRFYLSAVTVSLAVRLSRWLHHSGHLTPSLRVEPICGQPAWF